MTRYHSQRRLLLDARLSRRGFLGLASIGSGLLLFSGCRGERSGNASSPSAETETPTEVSVPSVAGYDEPGRWDGRSLTVTSWGGEYQTAQEQAIIEPFQRLTGATIEMVTTDIVELREQVESAEVRWDVCDVLTEDVLPLANLGVVEELDYSVIDAAEIFPEVRMDHGIGSAIYATVLSYATDRWPDRPPPAGWGDFWNLDAYPGMRGLHREAQTTLEFALIADGVPVDQLYPLDVERAFASLDRIRPSLTLWWEQGAQPVQSLASGDLDMTSAWHSRIYRLRDEGAPIDIQWEGGALSGDSWVIPRGTPNRDVALDFIQFATRSEVCAAFSSLVPFGPVNRNAFDLLPAEIVERLPNAPQRLGSVFMIDHDWWFRHREMVGTQFEDWLAEHP